MPDDPAAMIHSLVGEFARLRASAGQPSLALIERRSERLQAARTATYGVRVTRLPRSTVHDLLHRDHTRPPRTELAESLWAVLCDLAAEKGRPPRPDGLNLLRLRLDAINAAWQSRPLATKSAPDGVGTAFGKAPGIADGAACDGDEDAQRRWLLESASRNTENAWWHVGRHLVPEWLGPYLTLERQARLVRSYAPRFIPGLLQTEAYARAAFRRDRPAASTPELDGLVHLRMRRQEPLWQPNGLRLWAIIDEGVLRDPICGDEAMHRQIDHLCRVTVLPPVTIQVMPKDAHGHDSADGPLSLLRFREPRLPDVAFVEQRDYGLYPTRSNDVGHYRALLGRLAIEALSPEDSERLLRGLRG